MDYTPPNILISTVGTSLKGNLDRLQSNCPPSLEPLRDAWRAHDLGQTAARLRDINAFDGICGAEINTVYELVERYKYVQPKADLYFCVSDTEDGDTMGRVLKSYYEEREHRVIIRPITGLQDANQEIFRVQGLRNLVQEIGKMIRNAGWPGQCAINATGGYKAQIALAALIGQTLRVTVYYKHDRFPSIISLPPMPVTFDYDIEPDEKALIEHLEEKGLTPWNEPVSERLNPLVEEIEENGVPHLDLSAVGQIFLEGYRLRHPVEKTLPPDAPADRRTSPTFRDDHYPDGFKEYVVKIWRETSYVTGCHSLEYSRQQSIKQGAFYIRDDGQIVGEYKPDNFGARFAINTTAIRAGERQAVIDDLTKRYGR